MEALIHSLEVTVAPEGSAIFVKGSIVGAAEPGMFLHIPINGLLNLTVEIGAVEIEEGFACLTLDCADAPDSVDLVMAFNFEDEILWRREEGEA